jgi:uncharacterized protein YndB with AHSA1/START domain
LRLRLRLRRIAMAEVKVEAKVVHGTFVVERSFAQPPHVVFQALSETDKVRQWMGPGEGSHLLDFQCDFREGGLQIVKYRMGPKTPLPGVVITNEVRFQCIATDERIVTTSTMKRDEWIFSASLVTFELIPAGTRTDLVITHQGAFFEGSDGPAMRKHGWNVLADKLAGVLATEAPAATRP